MPDIERLLSALALVALLLYLVPAVLGTGASVDTRRWLQRGAILVLGTAFVIALVAAVAWYAR
jgi:hypothetical protein